VADQWAEFLISAVEYSDAPRHIARVAMRLDRGDKVGPKVEMSRPVVMAWLRAGYTVATIYKGSDNKWQKGADVAIVTRDGKPYIRTDADNKAQDNLGELPGF
jgi:hypothetical protein